MPGDTIHITEEFSGQTITVKLHSIIQVELQARLSTGYTWQETKDEYSILGFNGKSSTRTKEIPGGSELTTFFYEAQRKGNDRIELIYTRPFNNDGTPLKTFVLEVEVKDQ